MRRRFEGLVKDDLGKPDVPVELVEPLMRHLAGIFQPDAGPLRDLLVGQEAAFFLDPLLGTGNPPGPEKVGVDRLCRYMRLPRPFGRVVSELRHFETELWLAWRIYEASMVKQMLRFHPPESADEFLPG